jgi:hypothetical protein
MGDIRRGSERREEQFPTPTHQEIEKRAYEIYLDQGCEQGHALEDWFAAEEQLLWQSGRLAHLKPTTIAVGPDGGAEITPERDVAIADEELAQVRASEKIKEEREHAISPTTKAASVGRRNP